jgi:hypothetical protein
MAYSYHYVPIGSNPLPENYFSGETPHLLTFSKIKSDITDEATAHLHSHLEIFYFESGFGILTSGDVKIPLMSHCLVVANAQHFHVQHSDSEGAPLVYYNFAVDRLKLPGLSPNTISENAVEIHRFRDADNPFFRIIEQMLSEYGAVSAPVAQAMARGARKRLNADIAVSVTGLAGPGADEFGNPVGTVFIGYCDENVEDTREFHFSGDRESVRKQAVYAGLELILEYN